MKKIKIWWKKWRSSYKNKLACSAGRHQLQVSSDHTVESCSHCTYSIPHVHKPQWVGIKSFSGPARMGRFALAPYSWLFEGSCTVCGESMEKWDAIPLLSKELTDHLRAWSRISKETIEKIFKEFNES